MVRCKKRVKVIASGEKIVVQYDGIMIYEGMMAVPSGFGSLTKYWHKAWKPGKL